MSQSVQHISEQLTEILQDNKITDKGAAGIQEQVKDGNEVLHPEITSLVMNTVFHTVNNEFHHVSLGEAAQLPNAHPILQSTDDSVPGQRYWIPGLSGTKFLGHQVWAIWCIVRRWVCDSDIPGALVVDEMGLGKTFTSVAAAMICKLQTEKVVLGLPLAILWGNTLHRWVNTAQNNFPRIIGKDREWNPLCWNNSVRRRLSEMHTTPPHGPPALTSALDPILVVTIPRLAEIFKSVVNKMTYWTKFIPVHLLHTEHSNVTHENLNSSMD